MNKTLLTICVLAVFASSGAVFAENEFLQKSEASGYGMNQGARHEGNRIEHGTRNFGNNARYDAGRMGKQSGHEGRSRMNQGQNRKSERTREHRNKR